MENNASLQEALQTKVSAERAGVNAALLHSFRKVLQGRLKILGGASQQKLRIGRPQQQEVVQGRGARQHHIQMEPPGVVIHWVLAILSPRTVDDDTALESSPGRPWMCARTRVTMQSPLD